jgi:hypothetical protein
LDPELEILGQYEPKKHNNKHKKNSLSDGSHHRSADDLSDRRSVPSRTTSPKSDLEDGWNLVEDDLPESPSPEPHGATPSKDAKKSAGEKHGPQQQPSGHNSSNTSWNSNFRTKVYCSLYNMYHSRTFHFYFLSLFVFVNRVLCLVWRLFRAICRPNTRLSFRKVLFK